MPSGRPTPVRKGQHLGDTNHEHGGSGQSPPSSDVVRGGAAAESSLSTSRVGEVLAGRYRIDKELGTGGMGTVYRAEHVHMRKAVAVKILHREMTYLPEVVARFEREAVAAARIEHPNVAAATDFGRLEDGAFYLVLEYLEGQSLRTLLDATSPLSSDIALHVARQIASALSAAHAALVVHRDLKPDNVMLLEREGDPFFVKVLDFGIAKVELGDNPNPLTQLGSVFGTPEYMAPEQAAGTPVDARADLYTLGIILYEMLAGKTPFADSDLVVVLTRQMTAEPPTLSDAIDPRVRALVARLLAKDPDRRPATAADVVAMIDACRDGGVTPSPPPSALPVTPSPGTAAVDAAPESRVGESTPESRAHDVAYGETVLSLSGQDIERLAEVQRARAKPAGPITQFLRPVLAKLPVLARRVDVGGQSVPVWALAASGIVLLSFVLLLLIGLFVAKGVSGRDDAGSSASASPSGGPGAPPVLDDVEALAKRALSGDKEAILKLAARPEAQRSSSEWRALGRGYSLTGQPKAGLQAYKKALGLDPALAKDAALVADVRKAALHSSTTNEALELALGQLGSRGADLAYDVWSSSRSSKDQAEVARLAKVVVDGTAIRSKASPALLVALDLAKAKSCGDYKTVLPRAKDTADGRSLTRLKSLTARRGCGFLGLGDCFSCLRGSDALDQAVKSAEGRPAPTFE